jgi:hypothetical protein
MQSLRIVLLCVVAAVCYGIIHDQITARICVEYFTIGHPPVFGTEDPTLLGIGWSIIATWWVGLLLGVPLAIAARAGKGPKRTAASIVRPIVCLMGITAVCAGTAGLTGFLLDHSGIATFDDAVPSRVPADRRVAFVADGWAHGASYLVGFLGGVCLIRSVWASRARDFSEPEPPVLRC